MVNDVVQDFSRNSINDSTIRKDIDINTLPPHKVLDSLKEKLEANKALKLIKVYRFFVLNADK